MIKINPARGPNIMAITIILNDTAVLDHVQLAYQVN